MVKRKEKRIKVFKTLILHFFNLLKNIKIKPRIETKLLVEFIYKNVSELNIKYIFFFYSFLFFCYFLML